MSKTRASPADAPAVERRSGRLRRRATSAKAALAVRSASLRVSLLQEEIAQRIARAHLDELFACGIDGDTIDRLRALPAEDLHHVAAKHTDIFSVAVDGARLRWALDGLERHRRETELLDYYVANGATLAMIRALLKPEREVLDQYFRWLRPTRLRGRPALLEAPVRDRIHAAWARLARATPPQPERERLMSLHRQFQPITLATLYAVLSEFKR